MFNIVILMNQNNVIIHNKINEAENREWLILLYIIIILEALYIRMINILYAWKYFILLSSYGFISYFFSKHS